MNDLGNRYSRGISGLRLLLIDLIHPTGLDFLAFVLPGENSQTIIWNTELHLTDPHPRVPELSGGSEAEADVETEGSKAAAGVSASTVDSHESVPTPRAAR
jgi:hypothetical protein